MASVMDALMAGGWSPMSAAPPAQFDEYGNPVPIAPPPPVDPFPEIKKKKPPIADMAPQAGIYEPGITGQTMVSGQDPGDRVYHPDPFMPGTDYPAIPTPATRKMQALVNPDYESTAERVPMPMARPPGADVIPTPQARPDGAPARIPTREADGSETNAPTDISSSNRGSMQAQTGADGSMQGGPNFLQRLAGGVGNFLQNNSNTLLALGAGFAGAPNIGQGISRAAAAAIPASQADLKNRLQTQGQSGVYQALVAAGAPRQMALAAIGNPEIQKALIQNYITDKGKMIQMIKSKDGWGNETEVPYVVNKFAGPGEPVMTPAFMGSGGQAAPAPGQPDSSATFAPGVTAQTFDHSKIGEDYLAQYSPEMRDWVKNYLAGNGMPTGRQASSQMIKAAAMKYGTDIGMPPDDASIGQRKEWSKSLGNTQSGVGLQTKGFQQGLEHFVKLSDNLVKMNLSNGLGFEPAAGWANYVKSLSADQQLLIHKSNVEGQALAREMGNLFAKNGGGVHEAAETKANISNAFMSSKAAAGSLEAVDELMQGGLKTLVNRRDELFPNGNAPRGSNFLGPDQEAALQHIRKNIAILKGEEVVPTATPAAAAPAPVVPKPGRYRADPTTGTMVLIQ